MADRQQLLRKSVGLYRQSGISASAQEKSIRMTGFIPVSMEKLRERGIAQPDFIYVNGDAYVDHLSFGAAIICRILEHVLRV